MWTSPGTDQWRIRYCTMSFRYYGQISNLCRLRGFFFNCIRIVVAIDIMFVDIKFHSHENGFIMADVVDDVIDFIVPSGNYGTEFFPAKRDHSRAIPAPTSFSFFRALLTDDNDIAHC